MCEDEGGLISRNSGKGRKTEMPIGVKDSTAGISEGRGSIPRLAIGNEILTGQRTFHRQREGSRDRYWLGEDREVTGLSLTDLWMDCPSLPRRQGVRHSTLTAAFDGSNPSGAVHDNITKGE